MGRFSFDTEAFKSIRQVEAKPDDPDSRSAIDRGQVDILASCFTCLGYRRPAQGNSYIPIFILLSFVSHT